MELFFFTLTGAGKKGTDGKENANNCPKVSTTLNGDTINVGPTTAGAERHEEEPNISKQFPLALVPLRLVAGSTSWLELDMFSKSKHKTKWHEIPSTVYYVAVAATNRAWNRKLGGAKKPDFCSSLIRASFLHPFATSHMEVGRVNIRHLHPCTR